MTIMTSRSYHARIRSPRVFPNVSHVRIAINSCAAGHWLAACLLIGVSTGALRAEAQTVAQPVGAAEHAGCGTGTDWNRMARAVESILLPVPPLLPPDPGSFFVRHQEEWRYYLHQTLTEEVGGESIAQADRYFHWIPKDAVCESCRDGALPGNREEARLQLRDVNIELRGFLPWAMMDAFDDVSRSMASGDDQLILRSAARWLALSGLTGFPSTTMSPCSGKAKMACDHCHVRSMVLRELVSPGSQPFGQAQIAAAGIGGNQITSDARWMPATHYVMRFLDSVPDISLVVRQLERRRGLARMIAESAASTGRPANRCFWWRPLLSDAFCSSRALAWAGILASWEEAGRPALNRSTEVRSGSHGASAVGRDISSAGNGARKGGTELQPGTVWIGSRHSRKIHHVSCPHASRIRDANKVAFPSLEAAIAAGRTACLSCATKAD